MPSGPVPAWCRPRPGLRLSDSLFREIRHRLAQDAVDRSALLALERLLEFAEPDPHGFERGAHRAGGDDAGDADLRNRLLAREQDLVQPLARPDSGIDNLDVLA